MTFLGVLKVLYCGHLWEKIGFFEAQAIVGKFWEQKYREIYILILQKNFDENHWRFF